MRWLTTRMQDSCILVVTFPVFLSLGWLNMQTSLIGCTLRWHTSLWTCLLVLVGWCIRDGTSVCVVRSVKHLQCSLCSAPSFWLHSNCHDLNLSFLLSFMFLCMLCYMIVHICFSFQLWTLHVCACVYVLGGVCIWCDVSPQALTSEAWRPLPHTTRPHRSLC